MEILDLGYNHFNRSIIQSLSLLTSLKNLILHHNQLEGSFPTKGMFIFHNSLNNIKTVPTFHINFYFFYAELSVFEDLEMLDLGYNLLNGSITMQGRGEREYI